MEPSFAPVKEIGYLRDLDAELIEIWNEHQELQAMAEQLERSIRI